MFLKGYLMLGEKRRMWLKQFKIAIVQKDIEHLEKLLDNLPKIADTKEIEEALYLLDEAKKIMQNLKDTTAASMVQMKKNIDFLNSTEAKKTAKFDVIS